MEQIIRGVHDANEHARRFGPVRWREPRYGDNFRTCSYCGCINPEDLFNAQGWFPSWADQKYGYPHKFYVGRLPNPDPNKIFVTGTSYGKIDDAVKEREGWVSRRNLNEAQAEALRQGGYNRLLGWPSRKPQWFTFGTHTYLHAKFYTEHYRDLDLSGEMRDALWRRSGLWIEFAEDGSIAWQGYNAHFPDRVLSLEERVANCEHRETAHKWPHDSCAPCGWRASMDPNWGPAPNWLSK